MALAVCRAIPIQNMRFQLPPTGDSPSTQLDTTTLVDEDSFLDVEDTNVLSESDTAQEDLGPILIDGDATLETPMIINIYSSETQEEEEALDMPNVLQEAEATINAVMNALINGVLNPVAGNMMLPPPDMMIEVSREYMDDNIHSEVAVEVGLSVVVIQNTVFVNGIQISPGDIHRLSIPLNLLGRKVSTGEMLLSQATTADVVVHAELQSPTQLLVEAVIGTVSGRQLPQLRLQQALITLDQDGNEIFRETKVVNLDEAPTDHNDNSVVTHAYLVVLSDGDNQALEVVVAISDADSSPSSASDSSPTDATEDHAYCSRAHGHWARRRVVRALLEATLVVLLSALVGIALVKCIRHCRSKSSRTTYLHNVKLHYDDEETLLEESKKSGILLV